MLLGEGIREMSLRSRCVIDGMLLVIGVDVGLLGDGVFTV